MAGLAAAFGSGAMTNTIGDIEQADVILITGSNTTENHPVIASVVKRAVHLKGKTLIVVDPRRIKISDFAHTWLRPHLGTDVAWINGMLHVIIAENLHAKEFVESRTTGFEALKQAVAKYTPEYVEAITGIPARDLRRGRAPLCGGRARQHPLLHGDHPAHHRHRQRQVARQPGHALRQPGHRRAAA